MPDHTPHEHGPTRYCGHPACKRTAVLLPVDPDAVALVRLSEWIDAGNAHRDPEAITWGRLAKIAEENGEVIEAFIALTGQNPRKGVCAITDDVVEELLDVAVTALGAIEHLRHHDGQALRFLSAKIQRVARRAGVTA